MTPTNTAAWLGIIAICLVGLAYCAAGFTS